MTPEALLKQLKVWRLKDDRIVFTNGCFDILHAGHVQYLEHAAKLGNRLVVGVNSDGSVKRLKGDERPLNVSEHRALILASLHFVDAVVVFEEDTPELLIGLIRPDVLVKGADYKQDEIAGSRFVHSYGGKVELIPLVDGVSTSELIEKIRTS